MDAFAVAVASGVVLCGASRRQVFRLSFHFGLFQFMMPVIGWLAGLSIRIWVDAWDHWVAFALLAFIGGKMIVESFQPSDERDSDKDPTRGMTLVLLSIATIIDALAVGISFAMIDINIWYPCVIIGLVAAGMTAIGMRIGCRVGTKFGHRMEMAGGVVLILIGAKILLQSFGG